MKTFALIIMNQRATTELGTVYKGRPPKSQIFKPPLPCPGVSEFPKPPPPQTSASGRFFNFYTSSNKFK